MLPERYRAIFISDTHLGSAQAQVELLENFLRSTDCETLYLVGDVVDTWVAGRPTRWKIGQEQALLALLEKASPTCDVKFTPGNHDAVMRRFIGIRLYNTEIQHSFIHRTRSGKKYLVIHGDESDKFVTTYMPIAWVMAWMHEGLLRINGVYNHVAKKRGWRQSDFARQIKRKVKNATEKITHFEDELVEQALRVGCQGVICGHVHRPNVNVHENGITYINTGDWVEACSYVVENENGDMELRYWQKVPTPEGSVPSHTPR
jgi:UDP-2,3-diacylglucosamine pyrophosphatase LpxH